MIVLEIMGRPSKYISDAMADFINKIGMEKGITILNKKTHKAKEIERKDKEGKKMKIPEEQKMYSLFSELELESESIYDLMRVVFAYMPSHVEILKPQNFPMKNFEVNTFFNEIVRKMHEYEAITKKALMNNQILQNKFRSYMKKYPPKKQDQEKDKKD